MEFMIILEKVIHPDSVNYTYTQVGEYTAKFVVVDNNGSKTTTTFVIIVKAPNNPPTCSLDASPSSGYAPLVVSFSLNASDSDGYIASWKFDANGDGIADYNGNGEPPSTLSYTYNNAGTYVANLTAMDNNSSFAYATITIVVKEKEETNKPPCADFTYSINNLTVTFTDLSYDEDGSIVSWHWSFGDNSTSNERNPSHVYSQEGTYSVSLTVEDNEGANDIKTVSIIIATRKRMAA